MQSGEIAHQCCCNPEGGCSDPTDRMEKDIASLLIQSQVARPWIAVWIETDKNLSDKGRYQSQAWGFLCMAGKGIPLSEVPI